MLKREKQDAGKGWGRRGAIGISMMA